MCRLPGHGPTGGWEIVDANRDYMGILYSAVEPLYEEGKHISLAYLQVEEAAF